MDAIECFLGTEKSRFNSCVILYPALFYQSLLVKSALISHEPILSKILRFDCAEFRLLVKNQKRGAHFNYLPKLFFSYFYVDISRSFLWISTIAIVSNWQY